MTESWNQIQRRLDDEADEFWDDATDYEQEHDLEHDGWDYNCPCCQKEMVELNVIEDHHRDRGWDEN